MSSSKEMKMPEESASRGDTETTGMERNIVGEAETKIAETKDEFHEVNDSKHVKKSMDKNTVGEAESKIVETKDKIQDDEDDSKDVKKGEKRNRIGFEKSMSILIGVIRLKSREKKPSYKEEEGGGLDIVETERLRGRNTNVYYDYIPLLKAIIRGDQDGVEQFLKCHGDALTALITDRETALLTACSCGNVGMVKFILSKMSDDDREVTHFRNWTPLSIAITNGNLKIAEALVVKYPKIIESPILDDGTLPVSLAATFGKEDMTRFLYKETSIEALLASSGYEATKVFLGATSNNMIDIAFDLFIKCPRRLAVTKHKDINQVPMDILASRSELFQIPENLCFLKALLYSCVQLKQPIFAHGELPMIHPCPPTNLFQRLVWKLLQLLPKSFGVDNLYELKLKAWQARELLRGMMEELSVMDSSEKEDNGCGDTLLKAVKYGNREFVIEMIKANPDFLWNHDNAMNCNLFMLAVRFRQANIFSLFYGLDQRRNILVMYPNNNFPVDEGEMLLQAAARLEETPSISHRVAPLELQRQLQWFKEVEVIVPERERTRTDKKNRTPRELFEKNYEPLRQKAETWMKGMASSCSVVAILIATIAFQAVFTVPGGIQSDSGDPIKQTKTSFKVFIITNVCAFLFSSTATFIFLGILTARHSFDDFLKRLPSLLITGQIFLILSIVTTLPAFCTALITSADYELWLVILIVVAVPFLPITVILKLQIPLLRDMTKSSRIKTTFDRNTKPWL